MLFLLPPDSADAATNMAVDAVLLEEIPSGDACFRHYAWSGPSVTFGYAQTYAGVRTLFPEGPVLCRRPTGGGIVEHLGDWTYALAVGTGLPACHIPAARFYTLIHEALGLTLSGFGVETRLAPCPRICNAPAPARSGPEQCFLQPVADDLLRPDGVKIAGAAMKRNRRGLLLQGSIDRGALPGNFDFGAFLPRFHEHLAGALGTPAGGSPHGCLPDPAKVERTRRHFADPAWNRKR